MKTKKKSKSKLHLLAIIWGIMFSALMFLIVGLQIIFGFFEDGPGTMKVGLETFTKLDDPGAYFIFYMIGYAIIWWRSLWGSLIIIAASIIFVIIAGFGWPLMFAIPGFLVGALYLTYWLFEGRKNTV